MEDILFISKCDHCIKNYELNIKEENGYFVAEFPCDVVLDKKNIFIRSWEDEQAYLESLTSYTDLTTGIRNLSANAPISGVNAEIGITDYEFIARNKIRFLPVEGHRTVNPDKNLVPKNKYLADFIADPKICPRCGATGVIKDLNINQSGRLTKVTGSQKIKQRVIKALITPLGMSPYNQAFGSELNTMVGDVITDTTRITLQKTIVNCIDNLIADQPAELNDDERILTIGGIMLDTPDEDKTVLYVKVIVVSAKGEYIDCSVGFNLGDK